MLEFFDIVTVRASDASMNLVVLGETLLDNEEVLVVMECMGWDLRPHSIQYVAREDYEKNWEVTATGIKLDHASARIMALRAWDNTESHMFVNTEVRRAQAWEVVRRFLM